ncbi:MAG: DUF1499 domain-containing protein [Acidobacteriota bacterium]
MSVATLLAGSTPTGVRRHWSGRRGLILAALLLVVVGPIVVLLGRYPMLRVVETGRTMEYPNLKPVTFSERPEVIFDLAVQAIGRLSGWTVLASDRDEGHIKARVVGTPLGFESEVTITVAKVNQTTSVNVRSETIDGRLDFGQNAMNIRRFQKELRYVLKHAAPVP